MSGQSFKSIFAGKQDLLRENIDTGDAGQLLFKLEAYKVITTHHKDAIEVTFVTFFQVFKLNQPYCLVK